MASSSEIAEVRKNTSEATQTTWTDAVLGTYIDTFGVAGASAKVWEQKAAEMAELVNVTEAGASHSFSNAYKQALEMAKYWSDKQFEIDNPVPVGDGRVRVKVIDRQ